MSVEPVVTETSIMTFTGLYIEPLDLDPALIRVEDVAHHLSNLCRFTGAVRKFYSVGEHCVRVMRYVEDAGGTPVEVRHALMHDAQEYALIDIPRPLKSDPYFGKTYRGAEARCEVAVAERFGLESHRMPSIVREGDMVLLATERRDLLPPNGRWGILEGITPLDERIEPWTPTRAERRFLAEFHRLFEEAV